MTRAISQEEVDRELTFEEYLQTPETNLRHEVIDGMFVMSPSPTVEHQLLLGNLHRLVSEFVARNERGTVIMAPADLLIRKIPKLRVRQPDLMFIASARSSRAELRRVQIIEISPDLAVEILSPSNTTTRWAELSADYASIGVPELWRVDPEAESVEVYSLAEGAYVLASCSEGEDAVHSVVLPGLVLPVRSIFE
jgi:Uma2 family endonuclease